MGVSLQVCAEMLQLFQPLFRFPPPPPRPQLIRLHSWALLSLFSIKSVLVEDENEMEYLRPLKSLFKFS